MKTSIIREDDDILADVRISLGRPIDSEDFYLVFRGNPQKVIELLETAIPIAKKVLTAGDYKDYRRRN